MAFSSGNSSSGPMAEINVTPLVDVMLVLLIIFMITTPLMNHKTKVELPRAFLHKELKENKDKEITAPITVSVRNSGAMFYNDEPIQRGDLESRLAVAAQKKPQPVLNIRGDRDTKMSVIAEITKVAQAQGMLDIGYVTVRPKPGEQK